MNPILLKPEADARSQTVLVSNLLMGIEDPLAPKAEAKVVAEVEGLVTCAKRLTGHLVVVSNEVGMGLVPANPLGRAYRDLLGWANQVLARHADEVYLLVAGLPQKLKSTSSTQHGRLRSGRMRWWNRLVRRQRQKFGPAQGEERC